MNLIFEFSEFKKVVADKTKYYLRPEPACYYSLKNAFIFYP